MTACASNAPTATPFRVMVVDDSAVARGLVARWLELSPTPFAVESCADGAQAIRSAGQKPCDVIVLDIEMPGLNGLEAIPKLLEVAPSARIVMASTQTRRHAEISFRALALGAVDYVTKPDPREGAAGLEKFRSELVDKVTALALSPRPGRVRAKSTTHGRESDEPRNKPVRGLRGLPDQRPAALVIGCSTGGPQALFSILKELAPAFPAPIFIAQHMPPNFTAILSEHLERISGRPCSEGKTGERVDPRCIYVAPGDYHMEVVREGSGAAIRLNRDEPIHFCRPAADVLFKSAAVAYGGRTLALVLTGMGVDGRDGARAIVAAGGSVIAQDEASSIVWGMPGAVAAAGLCSAIWPLERIGAELARLFMGASHAA